MGVKDARENRFVPNVIFDILSELLTSKHSKDCDEEASKDLVCCRRQKVCKVSQQPHWSQLHGH